MNHVLKSLVLAGCLLSPFSSSVAEDKAAPLSEEVIAATRLQIFLDRANFGPGKIDGRYGGFTEKALILYRQAHHETANVPPPENPKDVSKSESKEKSNDKAKLPLPDLKDLDLASVPDVFIEYEVTETDLKNVGELPHEVPAMAKLKWLPYKTAAEALAEKFHCDLDFLKELNPGKIDDIKAGDKIKVPNVVPFEVDGVKELPLLDQIAEKEDQKKAADKDDKTSPDKPLKASEITVKVETSDSMLHLFENGKLVAAYPVTIGSSQTKSPQGEWKVKGIARLPDFRYDKSFLEKGKRSDETFLLPPGPNNLVGVVWIALNKPGIGLHGTSEPDTVGRSSSHGCVRLANWDIAKLATQVRAGVVVSIH